MSKCKYFFNCPYVQPNGFTCNHEDEASDYCGAYKMIERWKYTHSKAERKAIGFD